MPWTSNSIFEARRNFVMLAQSPNSNMRGLCRRFNISPNTGYQTLERYRAEGEKGLQDRSRVPHRRPLRCSKTTELAVLSVRADHPTWGGRKIASHLQLFGALPCPHRQRSPQFLFVMDDCKCPPKSAHIWLLAMLHKDINAEELPRSIIGHPDLQTLLERLKSRRLGDRRRSIGYWETEAGCRSARFVALSISVGKPTVGTCVLSTKAGQQHCSLRASVPFGNSTRRA
jgi:transposase-like protein